MSQLNNIDNDPYNEKLNISDLDFELEHLNGDTLTYTSLISIAEGINPSTLDERKEARRIFNQIKDPEQEGYGDDDYEENLLNSSLGLGNDYF